MLPSRIIAFTGTVFEMGRQETPSTDSALLISESRPVQPSAALLDRKQTLEGQPRISRTTLPLAGNSISANQPLPELPGYAASITLATQRLQTRAMNIAFLAPVEIHPFGKEPAFADPSISAREFGLRPVLAKLSFPSSLF